MNLTLRVTYAATDGSMPESVEVEWTDVDMSVPSSVPIVTVLDRLLSAPATRSLAASADLAGSADRRQYSAGCDLRAGNVLEFAPDGLTLYTSNHPTLPFGRGVLAGVAGEDVDQGERMQPERADQGGRPVWLRKRGAT